MLGLVAVALLIAVGVSEFRKYRHAAQRDQFVADLKQIAAVFETYRTEKGDWAPGTNPEVPMPKGMEAALAKTAWQAGPPFGGAYEWIPPQPPPPPPSAAKPAPALPDPDAPAIVDAPLVAAPKPTPTPPPAPRPGMIAITAYSPLSPLPLTEEDLRYLDTKLDDGNLATGRFRAGFNRWPVYLVNARP